jgi:hypothetical protein
MSVKSEVREERETHGVETVERCSVVVAVVREQCGELYMQRGLVSGGTCRTKMTQPRVTIIATWGRR